MGMDDLFVATISSLGFTETDAEEAYFVVGSNNVEQAIEYLCSRMDTNTHHADPPKQSDQTKVITKEKNNKPQPSSSPTTNLWDVDTLANQNTSNKVPLRKSGSGSMLRNSKKSNEQDSPAKKSRKVLLDSNSSVDYDSQEDAEDYDEMDGIDEDLLLSEEAPSVTNNYVTFKVLNKNIISENALSEINRICNMFEISFSTAAALLKHFKWQSERLIEQYFDNPDRVLKEAGLNNEVDEAASTKAALKTATQKIMKSNGLTDCLICGDDLDAEAESCSGLPLCKHVFCDGCWEGYLTVKIKDGENLGITCMAHKCTTKVPMTIVQKVCTRSTLEKYQQFIVQSYVEDNPFMQWCPAPGCGNAVRSDILSEARVTCSCGYKFCFICSSESHAPANCDKMKEWIKKCKDDSETSNWLCANTKDCPNCKSAIEKNGGCNHMTCMKCRHEFCWICNGKWAGHSACNRFVEKETEVETSRSALERYLHYFHRYEVHEKSQKFEQALRSGAVAKMVQLQDEAGDRWVDVRYIDEATEQLIECRRTLKYTYVHAFYLPVGPEKELFEYLQEDLERDTERLSELLESLEGFSDKKRVIDLTRVGAKRLLHLLEGVKTGLTECGNNNMSRQPSNGVTANKKKGFFRLK